ETYPADARRQPLEGDARAGHVEPLVQVRVVGDELLHLGIGAGDILRITGERRPAEGADAAAEKRPDVFRNEAGHLEGVRDAVFARHLTQIVAVVEGGNPAPAEFDERAHVRRHGRAGLGRNALRIALLQRLPLLDGPFHRQVAVHRVVRGSLIGPGIGAHATPQDLRYELRGVAAYGDRDGLLRA